VATAWTPPKSANKTVCAVNAIPSGAAAGEDAGSSISTSITPAATIASHKTACHKRGRKPSSNSARANSQKTRLLPLAPARIGADHQASSAWMPGAEHKAKAAVPAANRLPSHAAATRQHQCREQRQQQARAAAQQLIGCVDHGDVHDGTMRPSMAASPDMANDMVLLGGPRRWRTPF